MTEGKEGDWEIRYHEVMIGRLRDIYVEVKTSGKKSDGGKFFKAVIHTCEYTVPQTGPGHSNFRLGGKYRPWKRVRVAGRYRLFFRYDSSRKIIVYAWINEEKNQRTDDSPNDVYKVFKKHLKSHKIPNDIKTLIRDSGPWSRF